MMEDLYQKLCHAPVFEKLPEKEIRYLLAEGAHKRLHNGDFLCHQGDLWEYAAFVVRGELRWAIVSLGGREQVLFRIQPGRAFWAHSMFDGTPMPAALTASKASHAILWPKETIAPVLTRNPETLWEMGRIMVATMRQAREIIYGLAFKPVAGRLARLLLEQAFGQEGKPVQRELTLTEIAATVATSQEVVCRLLYQFQQDKLLVLDRASFTLTDRDGLEELVEKA
jgi:CRP/FNR family transcriptional regulator, dissimilatory nitrate respiration regulator